MLTGYNAAGDVVEVNYDATSADPVPANGSVTFQIDVSKDLEADPDPDFKLTNVGFVADGFKATQLSIYITSWSNYFDDIAEFVVPDGHHLARRAAHHDGLWGRQVLPDRRCPARRDGVVPRSRDGPRRDRARRLHRRQRQHPRSEYQPDRPWPA